MTHNLSTGICIMHPQGPGELGKRNPSSCNSHCRLLHGDMLPVYGTCSIGHILSGFALLLHPFPLIRAFRAVQIFHRGIQQRWLDLWDEFADGGGANQPMVLVHIQMIISLLTEQKILKLQSNLRRATTQGKMQKWLLFAGGCSSQVQLLGP